MKYFLLTTLLGICISETGLFSNEVHAGSKQKKHYDRAVNFGKEGQCASALSELEIALKNSTNQRNDQNVSQAMRTADDCTTGVISQEVASLIFQSTDAGNNGSWDVARTKAANATKLAPNYAPVFHHLGTIFSKFVAMGRGNHYANDAIGAYTKALDLEPDYGAAHMNLGLAYGGKRKWVKSKFHLDKANSLGAHVPKNIMSIVDKEAAKL